jgi:PilZ domain
MEHAERRREPRSIPEMRSYISFGVSNGAIVSDFSAGGLGFQAVAPVPRTGTIRFYLSLEPNHRVEAVGEVVWTDETQKRGGLRFTLVPEEVRQNPIARQRSPQAPRTWSATPISNQLSNARTPLCPKCGNHNVHRSHRQRFLEKYLLRLLGICPYRCEACYQRFFRRG